MKEETIKRGFLMLLNRMLDDWMLYIFAIKMFSLLSNSSGLIHE